MKKQQWEKELASAIVNLMNDEPQNWRNFFSQKLVHRNGFTKRKYTAGNAVSLAYSAKNKGFQSTEWYTRKQIENLGGEVREGEYPSYIYCFFVNPNYGKVTVNKKGIVNKNEYSGGVKITELFNKEQTIGITEKEKKQPTIIRGIRRVLENNGFSFQKDETIMVYLDNSGIFHIPEEQDEETRLYNNGKILEEYWKTKEEIKTNSFSPLTSFALEIASLLVMKEDVGKSKEEIESREKATMYYKNTLKNHPEMVNKALKTAFKLAEEFK